MFIYFSNAEFHTMSERTLHIVPLFIGFKVGVEKHSTEVIVKKSGSLLINSGIQGYSLLKTTQVFLQLFLS